VKEINSLAPFDGASETRIEVEDDSDKLKSKTLKEGLPDLQNANYS
jgi:hypothetical protein